ncbi:MAG: hypothetical protein K5854_03915 [Prevotella sp.]|nr:hypothetical protein [Prevotella sp.]
MKTKVKTALLTMALAASVEASFAQVNTADSVMSHAGGRKFSIGGYGEVAMSRNFYSDNIYRYSNAKQYKHDPSHGRFDIPHVCIYMGYDFGKGWTMGSEIEFEHTGTGSANEQEFEEAGEWEQEVEKGGEVELEQFWLQKSFGRWANIRIGHIVVPVGLNNAHHEPLNFFTVYRPEGENAILPSTWHDTGISFWGRKGDFRYEVQFLAGLDAMNFNRDGWVNSGAGSSFEFKVANKYGFAARIDNYSVKGLRLGLSGYYGKAMHNSYPHDLEGDLYDKNGNFTGEKKRYDGVKGTVAIGSFDFTFNRFNWIVRGNADYGYVGDAATISDIKQNRTSNKAPYQKTPVGKNAVAVGIEAGYDVFSQIGKMRAENKKMYVFGRYEYYDSYIPESGQQRYDFTDKRRMAVGLNYYPLPQIAVKAEYSRRLLKSQYNDEPSVSIGIAYEGFFL